MFVASSLHRRFLRLGKVELMTSIADRRRSKLSIGACGMPGRIGYVTVRRDNFSGGGMAGDTSHAKSSRRFDGRCRRIRFRNVTCPAKRLRFDGVGFQKNGIIPRLMVERGAPFRGNLRMTCLATLVFRGSVVIGRAMLRRNTRNDRGHGRRVRRPGDDDNRAGDEGKSKRKSHAHRQIIQYRALWNENSSVGSKYRRTAYRWAIRPDPTRGYPPLDPDQRALDQY